MGARNPDIAEHTQNWLSDLGRRLRDRRRALDVSAKTTAEAAGMSRVTLHRIESGSPAVTIGAYANAAIALGLRIDLTDAAMGKPLPDQKQTEAVDVPDTVRVGDFPQLRAIAWQLRDDTELPAADALRLYERNWRHVDQDAMSDSERALVQLLVDTYSGGILLV